VEKLTVDSDKESGDILGCIVLFCIVLSGCEEIVWLYEGGGKTFDATAGASRFPPPPASSKTGRCRKRQEEILDEDAKREGQRRRRGASGVQDRRR
jgi:hypothetical protein